MDVKVGIWVTVLGVLGLVIGGGMYAVKYHRTIGEIGLVLGVILAIAGVVLMMRERKAATSTSPQPMQPAGTS